VTTVISTPNRLGFDDSLDVVAVHGISGLTGLLATGLLATGLLATGLLATGLLATTAVNAVNAAGANGLFYGGGFTNSAARRWQRW
jgi:Amt family ammonium transporter